MLIYLDNCCFNRPFDDQSQLIVHLEARAVLGIQEKIITGEYFLVWSYMITFENSNNPREMPRKEIAKWVEFARKPIIQESHALLQEARYLMQQGVDLKDSIHGASAFIGECDYFITTDKKLLNKLVGYKKINTKNPISFIEEMGI